MRTATKRAPAAPAPRFTVTIIEDDTVVLEPGRGLMWDPAESKEMTQKQALAYVKKLRTGGFKDWRLPTVEELFLLADRSKYRPAIDTASFPDCKSDWYWTSTPAADSPADCAWFVYFRYGNASWFHQDDSGVVRAVRASQ